MRAQHLLGLPQCFWIFFLSVCLSFFLAWPLWRLSQRTYAETDVLRTQNNNQFHRLAHIRVRNEERGKINTGVVFDLPKKKKKTQNKLRGSLLGAAGLG